MNVYEEKQTKQKKTIISISSQLLIPLQPSPTSFQNDTFLCYKETQIMNKKKQTDGLHRLSLSDLRGHTEFNRIFTTKGKLTVENTGCRVHAYMPLCI